MSKGKKVRVRFSGKPLAQNIPPVVRLLLEYYLGQAKEKGLCHMSYVATGPLPLSLNHQKKRVCFKRGGKLVQSEALKPEVHEYRELVKNAIGPKKADWRPIGVTAAVVLFESPVWLTKAFTVRVEDADNKIKPALDAAALATEVPDELHWQVHCFKIPSKQTRTIVYLFDLGAVVDSYE